VKNGRENVEVAITTMTRLVPESDASVNVQWRERAGSAKRLVREHLKVIRRRTSGYLSSTTYRSRTSGGDALRSVTVPVVSASGGERL